MTSLLWIFWIFDAGAVALIGVELYSSRGLSRSGKTAISPWLSVVLLLGTYAAQLSVATYAAQHQAAGAPALPLLPRPLTGAVAVNADAVAAAMLGCAAIQTYALLQLYRNEPSAPLLGVGVTALLLMSLCAPVMISGDAYAYVAGALLRWNAYAPSHAPFAGEFAPINAWAGGALPATPSPYGPLWLVAAWLVTAPFPWLLAKIVALRFLGVAALLTVVRALRALRAPRRMIAVAALNPGLAFSYVASAHNDLFGIALLCVAVAISRRHSGMAAAFVVAGGLVKIPFAVLGLPALSRVRSRAARVTSCVAVVAAAVILSWAIGGGGFTQALAVHVTSSPLGTVLTAAMVCIVVALVVAAVEGGRRFRCAVWTMPLASAFTLSSYVTWGLPYALARRNIAGYFLIGFPLASMLLEVKFMRVWTLFTVVPLVFVWQAALLRNRREASQRSPILGT